MVHSRICTADGEHAGHKNVSRRQFLKWMAAGMGTAVSLLTVGPNWDTLTMWVNVEFTAWGQTTLTFEELSTPFYSLSDWYALYLPVVTT